MITEHVSVGSETKIEPLLSRLRAKLASLPASEVDDVYERVEQAAREFARRGEDLASFGSQFRAKRVIETENCRITVEAHFGTAPSFWDKLVRLFRR